MQGAVYCFRSIISIESNLRVFVRFVSFCLFLISAPKLASYIAGGKDTDADSHSWLVSVYVLRTGGCTLCVPALMLLFL